LYTPAIYALLIISSEDGTGTPRFTENYNGAGSAAIRKQMKILLEFMQSLPPRPIPADSDSSE
jgi:hypothetical protein